jgi:hypothetical protein
MCYCPEAHGLLGGGGRAQFDFGYGMVYLSILDIKRHVTEIEANMIYVIIMA